MKPAWDRLGADYKESASVMIVDVDCTAEGSGTCQKVGVQGYPTIKYYPAGDKKGKDYQGGRDYDSLKSFVVKTLDKPVCDAATKKGCAKNEIEFLKKMDGKSKAELKKELKEKQAEFDVTSEVHQRPVWKATFYALVRPMQLGPSLLE